MRQKLPDNGTLRIEKRMPYICVYRYKVANPYFAALLKTQASYLIVQESVDVSLLLEEIARIISTELQSFLTIEMWPVEKKQNPVFEILGPEGKAPATVAALKEGFDDLKDIDPTISTQAISTLERHPPHLTAIVAIDESKDTGHLSIGVAIPTLYQNTQDNEVYPLFYRRFSILFSKVIKRAAYEFIRVQTANPFHHYLMLGKTYLDKDTLKADRKLAKISDKLSFLLAISPVNSASEWEKFKERNFTIEPSFQYRLIPLDPEKLKRKLFKLRIDKVEDPTIAYILREKRLEIEKKILMLEERGTPNFRAIGRSIFVQTEDRVIRIAEAILKKYPTSVTPEKHRRLDCAEFAELAQGELAYYQQRFPDIKLSLDIREDVAGIMVSKSVLLLNNKFTISETRADALLQHEIGTHILTYCNGKSQLLKQMHSGFAGYDGLQEGIAVLAEYLVGGLTVNRLRTLAGRVVAAEAMINGKSFVENFNFLVDTHHFKKRTAFTMAMRIYRGGGLAKDAVYLAGLLNVMDYLKKGGKLETLYLGKFNISHIELVEELLHRNILKSPVTPRFLARDFVQHRLDKVSDGLAVTDLLD